MKTKIGGIAEKLGVQYEINLDTILLEYNSLQQEFILVTDEEGLVEYYKDKES